MNGSARLCLSAGARAARDSRLNSRLRAARLSLAPSKWLAIKRREFLPLVSQIITEPSPPKRGPYFLLFLCVQAAPENLDFQCARSFICGTPHIRLRRLHSGALPSTFSFLQATNAKGLRAADDHHCRRLLPQRYAMAARLSLSLLRHSRAL